MPPKRYLSDRPADDTYVDGQETKKRKTHPHRGQIKGVLEEFKELLNPVTSESLIDFNKWEKAEDRRGVVGLDAKMLSALLEELLVAMDNEAIDAKLKEIDDWLAIKGWTFTNYIDGAREKSVAVYHIVVSALQELVQRIEQARRRLPGMPSYWMNSHRKANC